MHSIFLTYNRTDEAVQSIVVYTSLPSEVLQNEAWIWAPVQSGKTNLHKHLMKLFSLHYVSRRRTLWLLPIENESIYKGTFMWQELSLLLLANTGSIESIIRHYHKVEWSLLQSPNIHRFECLHGVQFIHFVDALKAFLNFFLKPG